VTVIRFNIKDNNINLKNPSLYKVKSEKNLIFFSKLELSAILNLYSKQVSKGSWRDYALDSQVDTAIFSIYRHTHDKPLYQIIKKSQKGFRNKPEFSIKNEVSTINKSNEILTILSKFEKKLSIR
jgi:hypothetical protein